MPEPTPAPQRSDAAAETSVVHGYPEPGFTLTPCCARLPFELPRTDRMTHEGPITCPGPPHDWYPADHGLWQCGNCLMTARQSTDEPDGPPAMGSNGKGCA